jgi:iron complex outermembrane receptor protein
LKTLMTTRKTQLALAIALVTAAGSMPGHTQMLEEVVVTATKRAEGLQDVPIAISVVSGEKIEQFGITELDELSAYLPNVHIGESGGNNQIFIRGVGSGNNAGFEQSVGTFIDGVYFGRARNSRSAFLDLQRVEVLKGPQSTLFGKNTIAGAINITTAQPEDVFEGFVEATYETELEGFGVTGMVSGPLTENLRGRLVAKTYERDGWMDNIFPGAEDGASQENDIVRGTLVWDASENLSFNLKAEHGEFGTVGANSKITIAEPTGQFLFGLNDPNFSDTVNFGYKQSQTDGVAGREIKDDTDSNILQLTATYLAGDYEIRSITAYTDYDYEKCSDIDYASIDFLDQCTDETHEQFTQEFLLTSPIGGTFEYLAGVYYQDASLEFDNNIGTFWSNVPPVEAGLFGLLGLTGLPTGTVDGRLASSVEQNTETWSAFVELTWNISDSFRTIFGVRYSDDEKDIDKVNTITSFTGDSVLPDATLAGIYTALNFYTVYDYQLDRSEDHVTGNLNFQWDATDDMMTYLNFATGYKAGGFDTGNNMDRSREFEDEGVESIELGMKWTVWDGRARINAAYFIGDYEDVQVSSFEGSGFVVGNAAKSEVEGIEADFEVAATESITINGAVAWLDANYKDYPNGPCTVDSRLDGTCSGATGGQDLSGAPLQFAPEFSGNLGIVYFAPLTDSLDLLLGADVIYTDDIVIAPTGDTNVIQDSYTKVNARVALESSDGRWSLAFVGKNLTDETTFNWGNDATLSGDGLGFDRSYFHQMEAPRTYEFQARYSF